MTADLLWDLGGPRLSVVSKDLVGRVLDVLPPAGVVFVARLDGATMVESDDVFRGFSEALNFPAYFGWNWDALLDCLRDLSWIRADRYLVLIGGADEILAGNPEGRDIFFKILSLAVKDWANPLGRQNGVGTPFKVVLSCDANSVDSVRAEVSKY